MCAFFSLLLLYSSSRQRCQFEWNHELIAHSTNIFRQFYLNQLFIFTHLINDTHFFCTSFFALKQSGENEMGYTRNATKKMQRKKKREFHQRLEWRKNWRKSVIHELHQRGSRKFIWFSDCCTTSSALSFG